MRKVRLLGIILVCVHGLLWSQVSPANDVYTLQTGYVTDIPGRELVPGLEVDGGRNVASTTGLVIARDGTGALILDAEGNPIVIVVDPGFAQDRRDMIDALESVELETGFLTRRDVTHVVISHHHPDHTLYAGRFPKATLVDFWATYKGDLWEDHADDFGIDQGIQGITLRRTPGHTMEDASLVVETYPGKVVFTHLWWFWSSGGTFGTGPAPEHDPIAANQLLLDSSRELITGEGPDCIIPGHGVPFEPSTGLPCDPNMVEVVQ